MRIIISGLNNITENLVTHFARQQHDVCLIGDDPEQLKHIADGIDIQALEGRASYKETMERAHADKADVLIAACHDDEKNILACCLAEHMFQIPLRIAYLKNPHYLKDGWRAFQAGSPITHVISPERGLAEKIAECVAIPGARDVTRVGVNDFLVVHADLKPGALLTQKSWQTLCASHQELFQNIMFIRAERDHKTLSEKDLTHPFKVDDEVWFICPSHYVSDILSYFTGLERESNRMVVLGGGTVGLHLAKILLRNKSVDLTVIEHNLQRADVLSEQLPRAMILHGNALEQSLLEEAGCKDARTVFSVMNDDENNILASLMVKNLGCHHVTALITKPAYTSILKGLGVDRAINAQGVTLLEVTNCFPQEAVRPIFYFAETTALGVIHVDHHVMAGLNMSQISGRYGVQVVGLFQSNQIVLPSETTIAQYGDYVVFIASEHQFQLLKNLF